MTGPTGARSGEHRRDCGPFDALVRLVPPPAQPVDPHGDWAEVEAALETSLPTDYKRLVEAYGLGQFSDVLAPLIPFGPHGHLVVLSPEPRPGLLDWAYTVGDHKLSWLTDGRPDEWTVVVRDRHDTAFERHAAGATAFLYGWLSGRITSRLLPGVSGRTPWFEPFRERRRIYVDLADDGPPYAERLRLLREALAPTTDRGGRTDHFTIPELGWLLAFENTPQPRIWAAVPPGAENRATALLIDVVRRRGWRILGYGRHE